MRKATFAILALALSGCGTPALTGVAPYGDGPRYRPTPAATGTGCGADRTVSHRVHLELFAEGRVMIVPAGIGIAGPRIEGAYAHGGRCRHPLHTTEPTGVIEVGRRGLTLGDLFEVWNRRLGPDRLLSFRAPVRVHVDGTPFAGDPRSVPLEDEAQIVVQAGGPPVEPHADYVFPERPAR